jgi:hypothetical protein
MMSIMGKIKNLIKKENKMNHLVIIDKKTYFEYRLGNSHGSMPKVHYPQAEDVVRYLNNYYSFDSHEIIS